jgi:hypothetical protein
VANAHPQIWPRDRKVPGPYFCRNPDMTKREDAK